LKKFFKKSFWFFIKAFAVVSFCLILAIGGSFAVLQTDSGKRFLESFISETVDSPDLKLKLESLDGLLPFQIELGTVQVSDKKGMWFEGKDIRLEWEPLALLNPELNIVEISGKSISVERAPESTEPAVEIKTDPKSSGKAFIKGVPIPVVLQKLKFEKISLGKALLGEQVILGIESDGEYRDLKKGIEFNASVNRLDGVPAFLKANLGFNPINGQIKLNVLAGEPKGGIFVKKLNLPGFPETEFRIQGEGTLNYWKGTLDVKAGSELWAKGSTSIIAVKDPTKYDVELDLQSGFSILLEPKLRPLVGQTLKVKTTASIDPLGAVELKELQINGAGAMLNASGNFDSSQNIANLKFNIQNNDPKPFDQLAQGAKWNSFSVSGEALGDLTEPNVYVKFKLQKPSFENNFADSVSIIATSKGKLDSPIVIVNAAVTNPQAADFSAQSVDLRASSTGPLKSPTVITNLKVKNPKTPDVEIKEVDLKAQVTGDLKQPNIKTELRVLDTSVKEYQIKNILLKANAIPDGLIDNEQTNWKIDTTGSVATIIGLEPKIGRLIPNLRWDFNGKVKPSQKKVQINQMNVHLPTAHLTTTGNLEEWGKTAIINASLKLPDLSPFSQIANIPLRGMVTLNLGASSYDFGNNLESQLNLRTAGLKTGIEVADNISQGLLSFQGNIKKSLDGTIRLTNSKMIVPIGTLALNAALKPDNKVMANWTLDIPRLSDLSEPLKQDLRGDLVLKGRAFGPTQSPRIFINTVANNLGFGETEIRNLKLNTDVRNIAKAPMGSIDLKANLLGQSGTFATDFSLNQRKDILKLKRINLAALKTTLSGDLEVFLKRKLIEGYLKGEIEKFDQISRLIKKDLSGNVDFNVSLYRDKGQSARFMVAAKDIELNDEVKASLKKMKVSGTVSDVLKKPVIKAKLSLVDARQADKLLKKMNVGIDGSLKSAQWDIELLANLGKPVALKAAGGVNIEDNLKRLALNKLEARAATIPIRLLKPARFSQSGKNLELSNLVLGIKDGKIIGNGKFGGKSFDGKLNIERLPLSLASAIDPTLALSGHLNVDASLSGTASAPNGKVQVRLRDFVVPGSNTAGLGKAGADLNADWKQGKVQIDGSFFQPKVGKLNLKGNAPLELDPITLKIDLPKTKPISGDVDGSLDLSFANDILSASGNRVQGKIKIKAGASGSIDKLSFNSVVSMQKAQFENTQFGTLISDINLLLKADNKGVQINRFTAKTPSNGAIKISGSVNRESDGKIFTDISINAKQAQMVALDYLTAQISSKIKAKGPLDDMKLGGVIKIDRAEIRIPENLPPSVVALEVTEKTNDEIDSSKIDSKKVKEEPPFMAELDLAIKAPRRIFVRGRGLETEMQADIRVTGTTNDPNINGGLSMRRGTMELLGRQLTFNKGAVNLDGVPKLEPTLDFNADIEAKEWIIHAGVTGPASQPGIALSATPELPQDEVLARLLFGKSAGAITPLEAVQMGNAAAELAGLTSSGPGIVDQVRGALGLDTLKFEGGLGTGTQVEAGRYVAEGVYVGVKQGADPNSTGVVVQVEVSEKVKLESSMTNNDSNVGVNMGWDY
jgi:translocation and assembly module TamB